MKTFKKQFFLLLCFVALVLVAACSDEMEDYRKFTEGGEINYTEKMDSIKVFTGRERLYLQGIVNADPKITSFRVYWNSKADSVVVPVTRTKPVDTLSVYIDDLEENIYNLEVRTYDDELNSSIPVNITAEVYGSRYQNTLYNRPVISNVLIGNDLTVSYSSMDLTTGVLGTEIQYTSSNTSEIEEFYVPIDSAMAFIEDFTSGSEYQYRTIFKPEPTSIDTFYTDYQGYIPEPKLTDPPYLLNSSYPFEILEGGSRWGTPVGWIHNEAALSHGGYGALDGELFDLESGWGEPDLINAKVYQTVILPAGTYAYSINIAETNYEGADNNLDKAYFTVAKGPQLPDVSEVETSSETLAYERVNKANGLNSLLTFTLEETTQLSIGVQTTNDGGAGRYLKINSFKLNQFSKAPYLENAVAPYKLSSSGSRWGTPENWIHNDAAMNHTDNGPQGAYDGNSAKWDLESGWGQPNIVNGKVYQVLFLEPGTYTYTVTIFATNYTGTRGTSDQAYFVVAEGETLPDVADVETAEETLVYDRVDSANDNTRILSFTISEPTKVAIGGETTNEEGVGRFLQVESFKLVKQ
ncbi:DUF4998 domain-containing protein [Leeuwenhoekiella polynyae]|uniref:DUF5013 domain-containing protein n=1 Tax=Leeuwenhoekiella polynyae TaxID=1550906 RepID=A0A4Q0PAR9_9FLAO|nr:DUF5013 domain-containing protein [Leeuwenhoekiella polynyae]RXG23910.1 putative protein DUF5013 [Leeuwenhoekiella polynyae]